MGRSFLTYNIHDGGMEAVVHGLGRGLLRVEDYNNLSQCDSLEDMKIHLGATDYGNFLQNEATLTSRVITEKALERIVDDFMWIRTNSAWPLSEFLDFITHEYQIANVLKLIQGARSGRGTLELIYKCHPLGLFEGIGALTAATSIEEVYEIVLIDSPIGKFFQSSERQDFDENTMEYMRSLLQKNYLEQYYEFCQRIGGDTWEVMKHILDFEADRFVITLTRNTYGSKDFHKDDRLKLYPAVGTLVDIHEELANTEDDDALKERLRPFPEYMDIIADLAGGLDDSSTSSLEAKFMERSVQLHKNSLSRQFQYGSFYSIFKLRELEVNNLMWIAECITQGMRHRVNEYIPIY